MPMGPGRAEKEIYMYAHLPRTHSGPTKDQPGNDPEINREVKIGALAASRILFW